MRWRGEVVYRALILIFHFLVLFLFLSSFKLLFR